MRNNIILLLFLGMSISALDSDAQKRRHKKEITQESVSEADLLAAESTFIEGEKNLILDNLTEAHELFLLTDELNPKNATVKYKLAESSLRLGDQQAALDFINEAISLDEYNKYFLIFKAQLLVAMNRYGEIASVYEHLVGLKGNEQYYYELAGIYQFQNKWDEALEAYDKAEAYFGITEGALREKQKIYLHNSDMETLVSEWEQLIAKNPDEISYVIELCSLMIANEMIEEAKVKLEDLARKFPDDSSGALMLSEIERRQGNIKLSLEYLKKGISAPEVPLMTKLQLLNSYVENEEAQDQLEELLDLLIKAHPDDFEAIAFVGDVYFRQGRDDKSIGYYLRAIQLPESNYTVWQQVVSIEYQKMEYDSLIVHCEEAIELYPNQPIFYFYGGVAYYMQQDFRRSVRSLEQGKKYTTEPGLLSYFSAQLGDAYNSMKEHEKSDAAYEESLEHNPNNEHVLNNYSYFLSLRGVKLEKAKKMASQLVVNHPENGTYLDTYGWVLYVMGDYVESHKQLEKAADLEKDGTIVEHLGDVLFKLGQESDAIEQWKRAKELGGTTDQIDNKINSKGL